MRALLTLIGLVVFFLLLPPKYDPAIWLKEFTHRKDEE